MKHDERVELKKTILFYGIPFAILVLALIFKTTTNQFVISMDILILALLSLKIMVDLRRYFDNKEADDDNDGGLLIKE